MISPSGPFALDSMDAVLSRSVGLLVVAILVAIVARRLRLPYTVGLVVAGAGLAWARLGSGAMLTHDFIFGVILPPLLFEAALTLPWSELRRDWLPVTILSILGVLVSAVVVGTGMTVFLGWPAVPAALFGVLIAATDPVAVIALFKDTGVTGRLRLLVESESLFNDGVAAVLFGLVLSWAEMAPGQGFTLAKVALDLLVVAGGGIFVGVSVGSAAIAVAGRTQDHLVETAVTTVAAYGSFLLAERLHASGVLAVVAAGLLMGNLGVMRENGRNTLSPQGRAFVVSFWEFAAFIANSLIFLLIGLKIGDLPRIGRGADMLVVAICLVQAGRILTVYPLCLLFRGGARSISVRQQHILFWGGLRGALALALALALPPEIPYRNQILMASFAVVAFSVVIQGVTMPALLKTLGFLPEKTRPLP